MTPILSVILMLAFLLFLILITGLEYAYLASNKLAIELKRKQGTKSADIIGRFFDHPETFWSGTVISFYILLIGFSFLFISLMRWVYSSLSPDFILVRIPILMMLLDFVLIVFIIFLSVGLVAKHSFEQYPEGKLITWSYFANFINQLFAPLTSFLISLSEFALKYLFNVEINRKEAIFARVNTSKFLRQSIQGHEDFDESNKELFDKALQLNKMKVRRCMIPRKETLAIDIHQSVSELKDLFVKTRLSKLIVYNKNMDHIEGYVHHVDIYNHPTSIRDILHTIPAVPETMDAVDLIRLFTQERKSMAWIIDEFGGTAGFVATEDILEAVFGDINDEYDPERFTEKQISKTEYIFSGRLELSFLNRKYKFNFPEDRAETISGFIIANHESIPEQGVVIIIDNFEFHIMRVSTTRIETIKMRVLPA